MSTAYSARKLLDPSAKKQRVKVISSKVQPVYRPRRPRCETVNTIGRKTGGRRVEFREDNMALAPRKETVHRAKTPTGEMRPPRSRAQVKYDSTMLGHPPHPQVTAPRKKILHFQKQAQNHWKPPHPRTQKPWNETMPKLSRNPITTGVPRQRSRIQREQTTKSSSIPVQNGICSREGAVRNHKPACIPPRNNCPKNTGSRVPCPRPTRERPVTSCAAPANRYDEVTRNKYSMFHANRPAMRACVYSRVPVF